MVENGQRDRAGGAGDNERWQRLLNLLVRHLPRVVYLVSSTRTTCRLPRAVYRVRSSACLIFSFRLQGARR